MTHVRPQTTGKDVSSPELEEAAKGSRILNNLFPDVPRFTVVLAVAYPHDEIDIDAIKEEGALPDIMDTYSVHVRAINFHTAVDLAMKEIGSVLTEDRGDTDFTLAVAGVFVGHHIDLVDEYDHSKSAFFSTDNAVADYEGA